jgi:enoyl-CoA hydratase/carnithine racemase
MTSASPLEVERRAGGILCLTFNRPYAANAIDEALADAFCAAFEEAASEEAVKAVVLSGAGARVFCAGVDLKNPTGLPALQLAESRRQRVARCLDALLSFEKPLIAALNGVASGAGCMLALLADTAIARDDSYLQLPEMEVGIPTFLGYEIIRRLANEALALDLVLSGRRMPFPKAAAAGLVKQAVPAEEVVSAAVRTAEDLGRKPALPYALNKRWINGARRVAIDAAAAESLRVQPLLHSGH